MELFDKIVENMNSAINLRMLKHNLLSSNVANADIPNYRGFDLLVEETLRASSGAYEAVLKRTNPRHMEGLNLSALKLTEGPYVKLPDSEELELDINRIMAELAENSIKYQATVEFLKRKLGSIKYAIEGR